MRTDCIKFYLRQYQKGILDTTMRETRQYLEAITQQNFNLKKSVIFTSDFSKNKTVATLNFKEKDKQHGLLKM